MIYDEKIPDTSQQKGQTKFVLDIINNNVWKEPEKSGITIAHTRDLTGTLENINGLIRRFFPKETNFNMIKHKDVKIVENWINNRSMKVLGFNTPNEMYYKLKHAC